jgi:hypothetical protein
MRVEGGRTTSIDTGGSIWKETLGIIIIIEVTGRSIRITGTMATAMVAADSTSATDWRECGPEKQYGRGLIPSLAVHPIVHQFVTLHAFFEANGILNSPGSGKTLQKVSSNAEPSSYHYL